MYDSKVARVGAGTGLISWAHDGTPWGVFDLNGNVTEWVAGVRQVAGEVQVIGNNDAANYLFGDSDKDQGLESALWKAFDAAGSLVTPECTIASGGTVTDTEAGATLKLQGACPALRRSGLTWRLRTGRPVASTVPSVISPLTAST